MELMLADCLVLGRKEEKFSFIACIASLIGIPSLDTLRRAPTSRRLVPQKVGLVLLPA